MNMKIFTTLLLCLGWLELSAIPPSRINFRPLTLEEALSLASREGKPVLVHFSAEWCMPCKWMEANTFTNPDLANFVDERYIALRIDIDDAQGVREKERYQVNLLPTILIFNATGELIGRHQESMAADRLLQVLQRYTPGAAATPATGQFSAPKAQTTHLNKPALVTVDASPSSPVPSAPSSSGNPPKYSDKRFGIQVGAFSSMENANRIKTELENRYRQPVQIITDSPIPTQRFFKVVIGAFLTAEEAGQLLNRLHQEGRQGYIREI